MPQPTSITKEKNDLAAILKFDAEAIEFFSEFEAKEKTFEVEKTNFKNLNGADEQYENEKPENNPESTSFLQKTLLTCSETLLPLLDDIASAITLLLKKVLSKEVFASVSYFALSIMGIIFIKEAKAEIEQVTEAYNNKETPERDMKIVLGIWNAFKAIVGAGISACLLICGILLLLGVAPPAFIITVLNPISMGLLTAICISRFLLNTHALDNAKKAEEIAKKSYRDNSHFNDTFFNLLKQSKDLEIVWRAINNFRTTEHDQLSWRLLSKINNHKKLTDDDDKKEYQAYLDRIDTKNKEILGAAGYQSIDQLNFKIKEVKNKLDAYGDNSFQKQRITNHTCAKDRINAENKVRYSFIELVGSIITLVGVMTGLLPVILFGAGIAMSGKIVEEINKPPQEELNIDETVNHSPDLETVPKPSVKLGHSLTRKISNPIDIPYSTKKQHYVRVNINRNDDDTFIPKRSNSAPSHLSFFSNRKPEKQDVHSSEPPDQSQYPSACSSNTPTYSATRSTPVFKRPSS